MPYCASGAGLLLAWQQAKKAAANIFDEKVIETRGAFMQHTNTCPTCRREVEKIAAKKTAPST